MKRLKLIFHLLISMAACAMMLSADDSIVGRHIRHLGIDQGLSNGYIHQMVEDADGYIWIATNEGLERFDGNRFIHFNTDNSGLSANELNCLAILSGDPTHLWIGTQRSGLCVMHLPTRRISRIPTRLVDFSSITSLSEANDGALWISDYYNGLQKFNPADTTSRGLVIARVEVIYNRTWVMKEMADGRIIIGHPEKGFSVLNPATRKVKNFTDIPGKSVFAIFIDENNSNNVWLGCDGGAALFHPQDESIVAFRNVPGDATSIAPGYVYDIKSTNNGEIWFATSNGGISILPPLSPSQEGYAKAEFHRLGGDAASKRSSSDFITSIFRDSFGNVWLGNHDTGIDFIPHNQPLFTLLPYHSFDGDHNPHKPASGGARDTNGHLWFGGVGEVVCYDGKTLRTYPLPAGYAESKPMVKRVGIDSHGNVWATVLNHPLLNTALRLNPVTSEWQKVDGLAAPPRCFYFSGTAALIGANDGVYKITAGNRAVPFDSVNRLLIDKNVNDLLADSRGNLWVATFGKGLNVISKDLKTVKKFDISAGFPSNAVLFLTADSKGRILAGTRSGLVVFDNGTPDHYTVIGSSRGLAGHVNSVAEDLQGNIWATTNRGVAKISSDLKSIMFYSSSAHTPLNTFSEAGGVVDNDGRIYFSSYNGIISFLPKVTKRQPPKTVVRVTDFGLLDPGKSDEYGNEIFVPVVDNKVTLAHDQNTIIVYFNVADYAESLVTDISYRLEGAEENWVSNPDANRAFFRNLPPGTYRLQVRQRQEGEQWSEPYTILTVKIEPPLWWSWWAKLLYGLVIAGAIAAALYYWKLKFTLRQELKMEKEKNRNIRDLNEERLRFYTNVTHELRTPLTLIMGPLDDIVSDPSLPAKYSSKLSIVRNSSERMLNLINGILEFRKTETQNRKLTVASGNLSNLVREIGLKFQELNHNPRTRVEIDIDSSVRKIVYDADMVTTIIDNLMSNALKYTPSGLIRLSLHYVDTDGVEYAEIKVADTGYGISANGLKHIYERYYQVEGEHQASGTGIGLALVKNLVELHQGTIDVVSEEGKGTTFTFRLRADNTYPEALHDDGNEEARHHYPAAPNNESRAHDAPEAESSGALRILVVEDNADIRDYIEQSLCDEFAIATAANGWEALKAIADNAPDIVVSDIMMPEMDGITLCRRLKEDMLTSHIPVILLTAKDAIDDKQLGYEAGADSYITKPFSVKMLRSRIHNIIEARRRLAARFMALPAAMESTKNQSPASEAADETSQSSPESQTMVETEKKVDNPITQLNPLDQRFMENVNQLIEDNIDNEELGVAFIADRMCMSKPTLYRKMMAIVGVTTNEYLRHMRLMKSIELYQTGLYNITQLAELTGFGMRSSYSKAFKKEFGVSPKEYFNLHFPHSPHINDDE